MPLYKARCTDRLLAHTRLDPHPPPSSSSAATRATSPFVVFCAQQRLDSIAIRRGSSPQSTQWLECKRDSLRLWNSVVKVKVDPKFAVVEQRLVGTGITFFFIIIISVEFGILFENLNLIFKYSSSIPFRLNKFNINFEYGIPNASNKIVYLYI